MSNHNANIIGVDVSGEHLDGHRLRDGESRRFANDGRGIRALVRWAGPEVVGRGVRGDLVVPPGSGGGAVQGGAAGAAGESAAGAGVRARQRDAGEDRQGRRHDAGVHGRGAGDRARPRTVAGAPRAARAHQSARCPGGRAQGRHAAREAPVPRARQARRGPPTSATCGARSRRWNGASTS